MPRLHLRERLIVSGIGLLFVLLFGIFMPWWLFLVFLFALIPMFYKLLTM